MTQASVARKRLLVIDDCAHARNLLQIVLGVEGYDVEACADGSAALERLESDPLPDLLLVDLVMPGMSGWDFLRRRKKDPRLSAIPVVIFSGLGQSQEEAAALGAAASLAKPIDADDLIDTLLEVVRRHCP